MACNRALQKDLVLVCLVKRTPVCLKRNILKGNGGLYSRPELTRFSFVKPSWPPGKVSEKYQFDWQANATYSGRCRPDHPGAPLYRPRMSKKLFSKTIQPSGCMNFLNPKNTP